MEFVIIFGIVLFLSCFCSACMDSNKPSCFDDNHMEDYEEHDYENNREQTSQYLVQNHIIMAYVTEPMEKSADECVICLEPFVKNEKIGILNCCHAFHLECITKWYNTNQVCPLCYA